MSNECVVTCYRGYTHAVFNLLQSSSVATDVGRYVRENLIEKEFIPEHMERGKNGGWYRVFGQWKTKYMYANYNQKEQKLYVPIAFCDDICKVIEEWGARVETKRINDYALDKIDVKMKPQFHDQEHQIKLIEKCSDPTPGMKGLAMQTGKGKTYSAIKSWVNLGYRGLVIVNGLVDQWIKSILEFTDIDKSMVYKLQEFNSLALLAQNPKFRPHIFVASLKTLQLFSNGDENYEVLPWNYQEFLREYSIGVKIVDECHQSFHATVCMDLLSNVPYNMYCSATFMQTSKQARRIFDKVYPKSMQFGIDAYDKYVQVHWYNFAGEVLEKRCTKSRGYNHNKYEKELMIGERKFNTHVNELIAPMINQYFVNRYKPGFRALIFCSGLDFVDALTTKLAKLYPQFKVVSYVGGNEMSILDKADIIVSTIGKSSTGLDVKGLILAINTVSLKTPLLTSQMLGRLRKRDDVELIYVDRCDVNIPAHIRHAEERKMLLKRMCSKFFEYNGLQDLSVQTGEVVGPFATI